MSSDDNDIPDYEPIIEQILGTAETKLQSINETEEYKNYLNEMKLSYSVTYCITFILCVMFNITVIFISCQKNKSFQSIGVWIRSLAAIHLVCSISVVFQFLYAYNDFNWVYKDASCKISSYIAYSSMFFTATMLTLWTIHSTFECIRKCGNCEIILVALSCTVAAVLACPSLFSREVQNHKCIDDYDFDDFSTTNDGLKRLKAAVSARFLFGLVVPALALFINCCVTSNRDKVKTKIICGLKIAYFVCWGPQIFLTLIQITASDGLDANLQNYGLPAVTMLAAIHCFISPLIFLLLGFWNKMDFTEHDDSDNRHTEENIPLGKC